MVNGYPVPNVESSPKSLPYLIIQSPNEPSGCGYKLCLAWPRIFATEFIAASLALEAETNMNIIYINIYDTFYQKNGIMN